MLVDGGMISKFADEIYMNLPNYFLVDLPPEATLTATMITEACQTLKRNRERYLATRSTQSIPRFIPPQTPPARRVLSFQR